jgi:hypothetical protein
MLDNPVRSQIESPLFYEGWAYYVESLPGGPTNVTVDGSVILVNYTNLPSNERPPAAFSIYYAWFNATGEVRGVTTFQAPAGTVALLRVLIEYQTWIPGVANCSITGVSALSPFAIASLWGQSPSFHGSSHPFPMNFSGLGPTSYSTGSLNLNVTLPQKNGVYTSYFVLPATCQQY